MIFCVFRLKLNLCPESHTYIRAVETEVIITVIKGCREVSITLMIEVEIANLDPRGFIPRGTRRSDRCTLNRIRN